MAGPSPARPRALSWGGGQTQTSAVIGQPRVNVQGQRVTSWVTVSGLRLATAPGRIIGGDTASKDRKPNSVLGAPTPRLSAADTRVEAALCPRGTLGFPGPASTLGGCQGCRARPTPRQGHRLGESERIPPPLCSPRRQPPGPAWCHLPVERPDHSPQQIGTPSWQRLRPGARCPGRGASPLSADRGVGVGSCIPADPSVQEGGEAVVPKDPA